MHTKKGFAVDGPPEFPCVIFPQAACCAGICCAGICCAGICCADIGKGVCPNTADPNPPLGTCGGVALNAVVCAEENWLNPDAAGGN